MCPMCPTPPPSTKRYETQEVVSFVNGILGSFVRAEFSETPPKPDKAGEAQPKAED